MRLVKQIYSKDSQKNETYDKVERGVGTFESGVEEKRFSCGILLSYSLICLERTQFPQGDSSVSLAHRGTREKQITIEVDKNIFVKVILTKIDFFGIFTYQYLVFFYSMILDKNK